MAGGAGLPQTKTPNDGLKHRVVVFRKEVCIGDEVWESIEKTARN